MKLILQISLGVFIGSFTSQFVMDYWHDYTEGLAKAAEEKTWREEEKARLEQGERVRNLLLQSRQAVKPSDTTTVVPPSGFVPDDAQAPR